MTLPWISFAVACGAGMLIGVERERHTHDAAHASLGGARTFTLVCIAGALAQTLGTEWIFFAGALLTGALISISYYRSSALDKGATTEIALFLTYLIGGTAVTQPLLAAAIAVIVASLLAARAWLHHVSQNVITQNELHDALILAAATLVVLPLTPDTPIPWLAGLNLRQLWAVVVVLLAIQSTGHLALRLLGAQRGLFVAGLISGFVSSTAAIAAFGLKAKENPALLNAYTAAAIASCASTFVQLFALSLVIYPAASASLGWICAIGVAVVAAVSALWLRKGQTDSTPMDTNRRMFSIMQTLGFALLLVSITAFSAWLNQWLGLTAAMAVTAIAGLADAHAAAASALSIGARHEITLSQSLLLVLIALTANTAGKIAASFSGQAAYTKRVIPALLVIVLSAWATWLWRYAQL